MDLSQKDRLVVFDSPLGKDALNAVRFEGSEGLSEVFDFRVEALSDEKLVNLDQLVGQNCTVKVLNKLGSERYFNGICVEANWLGAEDAAYAYEVVLRPWFYLLTRTSDCRIFHNKTTPDIINEVLGEYGFAKFQPKLSESYAERLYTVQYCESDFDFVSRLMEEEGIYYFFEHSAGDHTMVLADAKSSHKTIPNLSMMTYASLAMSSRTEKDCVFSINLMRSLRPGKFTLNDYNYLKPGASMLAEKEDPGKYTNGQMEHYFYPGKYEQKSDGDRLAKVRIQEEQAFDERRQASGDSPLVLPGGLVSLEKHPETSQNIEYLVVQARHSYEGGTYRSGGRSVAGDAPYRGVYELIPSDRPFRAPSVTPKPKIMGPQTARVVGKKGEEIDVDKHGRILVHFFWDREKRWSKRVRVAQTWADKKWGAFVWPRIGQEVVVEHLEGDPDRPIVTGVVYNGDKTVPYDLPDDKNITGIKSRSTKSGSEENFNEISFDDTKDNEYFYVHAEKDFEMIVENYEKRSVGEEFSTKKGKPSRETVIENGDDDLNLKEGTNNIDIDKGDQNLKIKQGSQTEVIQKDQKTTINQGDQTTEIKMGDQKTTIKMGDQINKLNLGQYTTDAMKKIVLKCGASSIEMTPAKITIKSVQVAIEADVQLTAKGINTEVSGNAMLTVKGGLVRIN